MTQRWRCADLKAAYEQVLAGLDAPDCPDEPPVVVVVTVERIEGPHVDAADEGPTA